MPALQQPIFQWPSGQVLLFSVSRLGLAALLGALLGYQREQVHSTAGLRTHIRGPVSFSVGSDP